MREQQQRHIVCVEHSAHTRNSSALQRIRCAQRALETVQREVIKSHALFWKSRIVSHTDRPRVSRRRWWSYCKFNTGILICDGPVASAAVRKKLGLKYSTLVQRAICRSQSRNTHSLLQIVKTTRTGRLPLTCSVQPTKSSTSLPTALLHSLSVFRLHTRQQSQASKQH